MGTWVECTKYLMVTLLPIMYVLFCVYYYLQKCFVRKVDCTLVPCGHHCCCLACASKFDVCPVCFKRVQDRIKAIDV